MQQTPLAPEPSRSALRRLATKLGLEFVTLDPARAREPDFAEVNPLATGLVPEDVCRARRVLPIALRDGVLALATPDPFADPAGITDRPVRLVATTAADLDAAFVRAFGPPAAAPAAGRLGELLVAGGTVAPEQVAAALHAQQRSGGRVGELLIAAGDTSEAAVTAALAEQRGLPFADPAEIAPDAETLALLPEPLARRLGVVPLASSANVLDVAAPDVLGGDDVAALTEAAGMDLRVHLAPPRALEAVARRLNAAEHTALARGALLARFPEESAAEVLSPGQRRVFAGAALVALGGLLAAPGTTAAVLVAIAVTVVAATTAARLYLAFSSLGHNAVPELPAVEVAALSERELPTYTVLVPLLHEGAVVPRLLAALAALDYPPHLLDVRLLIEADDAETLVAVRRAELAPHVTIVEVPPGHPRTKPRALAYGLLHARGERLVVFDAEDRPAPDQLRRAVAAFYRAGPRVACLQARLATFNTTQNLLTRWFAADYAAQFDLVLPALARRGAPLPLGGTSNHFVTQQLTEVGGWDPYNVTEDADLGVRLHRAGLRAAVLDATTLEEATSELSCWVRQRSRWSKGHVQTLLVHLRHPLRLVARLGVRGTLWFALVVGGVLSSLAVLPLWALSTLWFVTEAGWLGDVFPGPVFHLAGVALVVGNVGAVLVAVAGALQRGMFATVRFALLTPLAWGLVSYAAWRGVLQLPGRPHLWEKTPHGLDAEATR